MRGIIVAAMTLSIALLACAEPPKLRVEKEVYLKHPISRSLPVVNNGYYVQDDFDSETVLSFNLEGELLTKHRLMIPGVNRFLLRTPAAAPDGTLAVPATAIGGGSEYSSMILWISSSGTLRKTVGTSPYAPFSVMFAGDGTLWVTGRVFDQQFGESDSYDVVRRYDSQGTMIQSLLPKSTFSGVVHPGQAALLIPDGDGMNFFFARTAEWVEVSRSGEVVKRIKLFDIPEDVRLLGAAVAGGETYFSAQRDGDDAGVPRLIYRLNKQTQRLQPVTLEVEPGRERPGHILGAANGRLILNCRPREICVVKPE